MKRQYDSRCDCAACENDAACNRSQGWRECPKYRAYLKRRWRWKRPETLHYQAHLGWMRAHATWGKSL